MALVEDLLTQAHKLQRARGEAIEAMAALTGMTIADIRRDLSEEACLFIQDRAAELIPDGRFEGTVSLHVLLSALRDAWKAGAIEADGRTS